MTLDQKVQNLMLELLVHMGWEQDHARRKAAGLRAADLPTASNLVAAQERLSEELEAEREDRKRLQRELDIACKERDQLQQTCDNSAQQAFDEVHSVQQERDRLQRELSESEARVWTVDDFAKKSLKRAQEEKRYWFDRCCYAEAHLKELSSGQKEAKSQPEDETDDEPKVEVFHQCPFRSDGNPSVPAQLSLSLAILDFMRGRVELNDNETAVFLAMVYGEEQSEPEES